MFSKNDDTQYKINSLLIHAPVPKKYIDIWSQSVHKNYDFRLQSLI